jgi:hypothetical protein
MLDTVLQIGRIFRNSPNGFKYHRYIKTPVQQKGWEDIAFIALPVKGDFSFDFKGIKKIVDENVIRNKLHYLCFKTSEADGLVKYIFGDIYYALNKGEEGGYYRLGDINNKQKVYQNSSFIRGEEDAKSIVENSKSAKEEIRVDNFIKFRESFKKSICSVENLLRYQCGVLEYLNNHKEYPDKTIKELLRDEFWLRKFTAKKVLADIKSKKSAKQTLQRLFERSDINWEEVQDDILIQNKLIDCSTGALFLHFDFEDKQWYDFTNEMRLINEKILEDFVEPSVKGDGFILKKSLYKTLSSPEKDWQFPQFLSKERYKNKIFSKKEHIANLMYAIDYSKTALIKIPHSDIKIIVLPKGENLSVSDYERFIGRAINLMSEPECESIIVQTNRNNASETLDMLFKNIIINSTEAITQFDVILSKQGGQSSPDADLIELAGIEKSFINFLSTRIQTVAKRIYFLRAQYIKFENLLPFSIYYSFLNILGDTTKEKKKYQRHLYHVIPLIYSGSYCADPLLLPVFITKVEFSIRNDQKNFNLLKYDFYFLTTIQNTKTEGENLMKILESPSYKLGLLLGKMAVPLKYEIKSFEKNYVGNLTRRIASLGDLIKLKTFVEEKLIIHDKTYPDIKEASLALADAVKMFDNRFDKNECAFGFFESYFTVKEKENIEAVPTK